MRVEDNKGRSIFYDKSGDTVLLATTNVWDNIKIVETYIVKYNVSNLMNIVIRYLDVETLDCSFRDTSEKIIYDVVEDVKKNYFPTKSITSIITHLEKYTNKVCLSILFT